MEIKDYLHLYIGCECLIEAGEFPESKLPVCGVAGRKAIMGEHSLRLVELKDVKPILRPLSDMTEEERVEYDRLQVVCYSVNLFYDQVKTDATLTNFLLSKHFDLFDLIPAGLAIDKTKLNVVPNDEPSVASKAS